jgi:hypothetical protein
MLQNETRTPATLISTRLPERRDAFWERQAYEKCCSLCAAALIQNGGHKALEDIIEKRQFWELFQAIKADGAKRFAPNAKLDSDRPVIQQEEINVEDIPF